MLGANDRKIVIFAIAKIRFLCFTKKKINFSFFSFTRSILNDCNKFIWPYLEKNFILKLLVFSWSKKSYSCVFPSKLIVWPQIAIKVKLLDRTKNFMKNSDVQTNVKSYLFILGKKVKDKNCNICNCNCTKKYSCVILINRKICFKNRI